MHDEELKKLRRRKDELVKRVLEMRDQLHRNSGNREKKSISEDEILEKLSRPSVQVVSPKKSSDEKRFIVRLVDATEQATRTTFQNVDKKWLRDNVWLYTCQVVLKIMQFGLKLEVDLKDGGDYEILDITCSFDAIPACHLQEIYPWVGEITQTKKFTHLMSAFSDYNDQCSLRERILDRMTKQKFLAVDKCSTGGYTIYVHSPGSAKKAKTQQYINVLWKMEFVRKTITIDHRFTIDAIEGDFAKQHQNLLEDFCKKGLKKEDLERLWNDLRSAVDAYSR